MPAHLAVFPGLLTWLSFQACSLCCLSGPFLSFHVRVQTNKLFRWLTAGQLCPHSVNYGGRWKPLHYVVKRAFAPVAVTAVLEGDDVQVGRSIYLRYKVHAGGCDPYEVQVGGHLKGRALLLCWLRSIHSDAQDQ